MAGVTMDFYLACVSPVSPAATAAAAHQLVAGGGGRVHDGDVEVARPGKALHRERVRHRARLKQHNDC